MTADIPPPPPAVPAQELRSVTWVYGSFDITSDGVTVHQRKSGPFTKAREAVYPLTDIASAEVYGSILTLRLRNGPRGIQGIAQPEVVTATLRAFGVAATYTEAADAELSDAGMGRVGEVRANMTESEKYFKRKNAAQRKRKIGRAVGTTACCGIPCLISLTLMLAVLATLLLALPRL
jgi:hypothetical protein